MNESFVVLAIVLIVALGGLAVVFIDASTGMAAKPPVSLRAPPPCQELANGITTGLKAMTAAGSWCDYYPEIIEWVKCPN